MNQDFWNWVKEKGTGFFGRPLWEHEYYEPRLYAWSHMASAIEEAEKLGADGDFLRACVLHLAELARKEDLSMESYRLSKADKLIHLSGFSQGLKKIQNIQQKIKNLREEWEQVKGMVEEEPGVAAEQKVDEQFATLESTLKNYIRIYTGDDSPGPSRGRPSKRKSLRVLSGMDEHLRIKTRQYQRPLLSRLTKTLYPDLQMQCEPEQIRSAIHGRNRKADLRNLDKEWKKLRNKFRDAG